MAGTMWLDMKTQCKYMVGRVQHRKVTHVSIISTQLYMLFSWNHTFYSQPQVQLKLPIIMVSCKVP